MAALKGFSFVDAFRAAVLERRGWRWTALCILAACCIDSPLHADVIEAWVQRYSMVVSNSNDSAAKVLVDSAGNVIVTGYTEDGTGSDILTIKYSGVDGAVIWRVRYDGPTHGNDEARGLAIDGNGDAVVTGVSGTEFFTIKYAGTGGATLWERRGPRGNAAAVTIDSNDDIVVTGSSLGVAGDYYTAKYSGTNGAVLWEQTYNGPGNEDDAATAVAVDTGGNVIVTGRSVGTEGVPEFYSAKYEAATGTVLWDVRGPFGAAEVIMPDNNSDIVVAGTSLFDYYTVKYAGADGAVLWEQRYDGPAHGEEHLRCMVVDPAGNVLVGGSSMGEESAQDFYTAKYGANDGSLVWERRYNGPANTFDEAQAIAVDSVADVLVTGFSVTPTNQQVYTAKLTADGGVVVWELIGTAGYGQAVSVDGNGDLLIAGLSPGDAGFFDAYTAKYGSLDGELQWEQRYNGSANRSDAAQAVAIDSEGNVIVTGSSVGAGGSADFYTAKYLARDGSLIWERRYDGTANGPDAARALALDANGDVIVTGESWNGTDSDFYTVKYAAADGAPLWERRYGGPGSSADFAIGIAIDGAGDVVVTGSSGGDFYTAKYSANDGALLWEQRLPHASDVDDSPAAIVVDGGGNAIVTGRRGSVDNRTDFYTAKYHATNGALMWERRYNGPANSIDEAVGLALDGDGNVVVAGYSYDDSDVDFYTAKYASDDGSLMWETRGEGLGFAHALALDSGGNPVVTGSSLNGEFQTVKYSATDGAVLWEKNGPAGNSRAVAIGVHGDVVIAGFAAAANGRNDYYTAKYAANDGALVWERTYDGPADLDDVLNTSAGLAVGPNGTIAVTGSSAVHTRTYDFATVVYWEQLPPIRIALIPEGVRLRFSGIPGRIYEVQRATVLGTWTTIGTVTAPSDPVLTEYVDSDGLSATAFYRIKAE